MNGRSLTSIAPCDHVMSSQASVCLPKLSMPNRGRLCSYINLHGTHCLNWPAQRGVAQLCQKQTTALIASCRLCLCKHKMLHGVLQQELKVVYSRLLHSCNCSAASLFLYCPRTEILNTACQLTGWLCWAIW